MAGPLFKGKLDLTKILKEHIFAGKSGKYIDITIWENKDGPDQYGNTHSVKQGIPKAARDGGQKEPYIGNVKGEAEAPRQQQRPPARPPARPPVDPDLDAAEDDIPF